MKEEEKTRMEFNFLKAIKATEHTRPAKRVKYAEPVIPGREFATRIYRVYDPEERVREVSFDSFNPIPIHYY